MLKKPKILFIGAGYVGLVNGYGMAYHGCDVTIADSNRTKIDKLNNGEPVIYEHDMDHIMNELKKSNNIPEYIWTGDTEKIHAHINGSDYIFIAVGTPQSATGKTDLKYIYDVAALIGKHLMSSKPVVVVKSTVPVGTTMEVKRIIHDIQNNIRCNVADNPEFLQEGVAFMNFEHPDRVVIGTEDDITMGLMVNLYKYIYPDNYGRLIRTCNIETAEMIKYASNAMLATRISFSNMIAMFCNETGADANKVLSIMGEDHRIGSEFLKPGCGYGGSCFPKDVASLVYQLGAHGCDAGILCAVEDINKIAKGIPMKVLHEWIKTTDIRKVTVLGAAFKPGTDDIRESPILDFLNEFDQAGMDNTTISIYDPIDMARTNISHYIQSDLKTKESIHVHDSLMDALDGADAIIILTPCGEYRDIYKYINPTSRKKPYLYDARNMFTLDEVKNMISKVFVYSGFGRNIQ